MSLGRVPIFEGIDWAVMVVEKERVSMNLRSSMTDPTRGHEMLGPGCVMHINFIININITITDHPSVAGNVSLNVQLVPRAAFSDHLGIRLRRAIFSHLGTNISTKSR